MPAKQRTPKPSKPARSKGKDVRQHCQLANPDLERRGPVLDIEPIAPSKAPSNPPHASKTPKGKTETESTETPETQADTLPATTQDKPADPWDSLKPREKRLVSAYLETLSPKQTAERCGITIANVFRALDKPRVRATVDARLARGSPSEPELLARIGRLARFDPSTVMGEIMVLRDTEAGPLWTVDWDAVKRLGIGPCIKAVDVSRRGDQVIRWHSQADALALLARVRGLTSERSSTVNIDFRNASIDELKAIVSGR